MNVKSDNSICKIKFTVEYSVVNRVTCCDTDDVELLSRDKKIKRIDRAIMLTARSSPLGVGRGPRTLGPAEGSDHLFLLPERALIMDSTQLRQDLAGLDFNLHLNLLHTAPRGNVWLCELPKDKRNERKKKE
ncbi:hypothetical protein PV325_004310 [Microctonus aethiopoides]|nr:hypothetical protein PV325_004310 [Microctonus aethiopoides]